jgi:hypothetical protein
MAPLESISFGCTGPALYVKYCLTCFQGSGVVTQTDFQSLLDWLSSAGNDAGDEYEACRKLLIQVFERQQCGDRAGELADSVFDVVARKLSKGDPLPIDRRRPYLLGVARNVLRDYRKKPPIVSIAPEGVRREADDRMGGDAQDPRNTLSFWMKWQQDQLSRATLDASLQCLDHCLRSWPEESRDLILEYYRGAKHEKIENRQRLAARLNSTLNALAIRTHRLRSRLEKCVLKCLESE